MDEGTKNTVLAIAAIIAAIASPAALILAAWITVRMGRVEIKVDGMSSQLVEATAGKNRAEGQLQERDADRLYRADIPTGKPDDPVAVLPVKGKV